MYGSLLRDALSLFRESLRRWVRSEDDTVNLDRNDSEVYEMREVTRCRFIVSSE